MKSIKGEMNSLKGRKVDRIPISKNSSYNFSIKNCLKATTT